MKSCGVTIAGVIISLYVSTMCMCSVPWCIVHVSVSSSFVNLQDVFEGLSKNGQRSGVHNYELSKVKINYLKAVAIFTVP